MSFYATETMDPTPVKHRRGYRCSRPSVSRNHRTTSHRTACKEKPLRGPILVVISGYRYYSPEMGRWVSRDPIGERGGLNVYGFVVNLPQSSIDPVGLASGSYYSYDDLLVEGKEQSQINSFRDALSHYRSGAGGVVSAGSGLYAEMRSDSSYKDTFIGNDSRLAKIIARKLEGVSKRENSGTISAAPGSYLGNLSCGTLGSYSLDVDYTLTWNATPWGPCWHKFVSGKCCRDVSTDVTVKLTKITDWNFETNASYSWWENLTKEWIPEIIAGLRGNPTPFEISLSLTETYDLEVEQQFP